MTENKRFKVAVYDENAINGFAVLDLHKPNISKRLKYENVYVGSKEGCEIVCKFGNGLAEENEQLKKALVELKEIGDYQYGRIKELSDDNEQLKRKIQRERKSTQQQHQKWSKEAEQQIQQLKDIIDQLRTDNTQQKKLLNKTMKQNHHIKTTIKTMMENERTELGRSVLRQLWEAIQ